jgi:hypothetical protein
VPTRLLDYPSFEAYCNGEFGTHLVKLNAGVRQAWMPALEAAGMTTRDIAAACGVNQSTTVRDQAKARDANASEAPVKTPRQQASIKREASTLHPKTDPRPLRPKGSAPARPATTKTPAASEPAKVDDLDTALATLRASVDAIKTLMIDRLSDAADMSDWLHQVAYELDTDWHPAEGCDAVALDYKASRLEEQAYRLTNAAAHWRAKAVEAGWVAHEHVGEAGFNPAELAQCGATEEQIGDDTFLAALSDIVNEQEMPDEDDEFDAALTAAIKEATKHTA